MTGQEYDWILIPLARDSKFVIRYNCLGLWLKIKTISTIFLVDRLDRYILSQDRNLLYYWINWITFRWLLFAKYVKTVLGV